MYVLILAFAACNGSCGLLSESSSDGLEWSVGARGDSQLMAGEGCAAAWFLVRYLNDDGDFPGAGEGRWFFSEGDWNI